MNFFTKLQKREGKNGAYCVEKNGWKIEFKLSFANRNTIAIHVSVDGEVLVKAPKRMAYAKVVEFVEAKAVWVLAKQEEFASSPHRLPENTYKFLGENYELKVELGVKNDILLQDGVMLLQTTQPRDKAKVKAQIEKWYRAQAVDIFARRLDFCAPIAEKKIDVEFSGELRLRKMKSRWGSCSSDGEITLNTELVAAPEICIDYVILHEMCHLREHNHSPAFYALMDAVMPKWKAHRKLLNQTVQIRKL